MRLNIIEIDPHDFSHPAARHFLQYTLYNLAVEINILKLYKLYEQISIASILMVLSEASTIPSRSRNAK